MTTYTIATTTPASDGSSLLIATVPDGADIHNAVQREIDSFAIDEHLRYATVSGLTLTDEEPEDEGRIVWRGHDCGWLEDENGATYNFAVRA